MIAVVHQLSAVSALAQKTKLTTQVDTVAVYYNQNGTL
jgi:hypothetical protein